MEHYQLETFHFQLITERNRAKLPILARNEALSVDNGSFPIDNRATFLPKQAFSTQNNHRFTLTFSSIKTLECIAEQVFTPFDQVFPSFLLKRSSTAQITISHYLSNAAWTNQHSIPFQFYRSIRKLCCHLLALFNTMP
jgi:hypothetical protein